MQELTKQSLRERPFSTVMTRLWTDSPRKEPMEGIYTRLSVVKKHREMCKTSTSGISDITQLLSEDHLSKDCPARILVKGNSVTEW